MSSQPNSQKPIMIATDLEGVWIPEVWKAVAQKTGIEGLKLTTRDIQDYDELMLHRLKILAQEKITLKFIQNTIDEMPLLDGAKEAMDELRNKYQVIILSDTFYEFAKPFMDKLGLPTLFCHQLFTNEEGIINDYKLRLPDGKREAVLAFKKLQFKVIAMGDSYNDTTMLAEADKAFLFRSPENVIAEFPQYQHFTEYTDLTRAIHKAARSDQ